MKSQTITLRQKNETHEHKTFLFMFYYLKKWVNEGPPSGGGFPENKTGDIKNKVHYFRVDLGGMRHLGAAFCRIDQKNRGRTIPDGGPW